MLLQMGKWTKPSCEMTMINSKYNFKKTHIVLFYTELLHNVIHSRSMKAISYDTCNPAIHRVIANTSTVLMLEPHKQVWGSKQLFCQTAVIPGNLPLYLSEQCVLSSLLNVLSVKCTPFWPPIEPGSCHSQYDTRTNNLFANSKRSHLVFTQKIFIYCCSLVECSTTWLPSCHNCPKRPPLPMIPP